MICINKDYAEFFEPLRSSNSVLGVVGNVPPTGIVSFAEATPPPLPPFINCNCQLVPIIHAPLAAIDRELTKWVNIADHDLDAIVKRMFEKYPLMEDCGYVKKNLNTGTFSLIDKDGLTWGGEITHNIIVKLIKNYTKTIK